MAKEQRSLAGKVVAITGGARGIGRATAQALIAEGAKVAIGDLDLTLVQQTARELGAGTAAFVVDVTNSASFEAFLDGVERELGSLDVLINNAGVMPLSPLVQESEAAARLLVNVNLHGVLIGSKLAVRRFTPRNSGDIVNIASAAGKIGFPGGATYSATKHAVVGLTEALRGELRGTGIETHLIMPVPVNTDLGAGLAKMRFFPALQPEDVAGAVVDALRTGRFENFVPRSVGPLVVLGRLLPRSISEWLLRLIGGDKVLASTDPAARAAYEARIAPVAASGQSPSVADVAASVASHIDS